MRRTSRNLTNIAQRVDVNTKLWEAAENLALPAFTQNGRIGAAGGLSRNALGLRRCTGKAHVIWPASPPRQLVSARRAARSFRTN